MRKPALSLTPYLEELSTRSARQLKTPTSKTFGAWRKRKRIELKKLLGLEEKKVLHMKAVNEKQMKGFRLRLMHAYLSDATIMPVYIGIPEKARPPYQPVFLYHGHQPGAKPLFGIDMTKDTQDYALAFLKKGYMVIAPDMRGFAERLGPSPITYNGYTRSCRQVSFDLMMNGKTLLGERLADCMALLTAAKKMPDILTDVVVVTGNSGGGTIAMLHAALDDRIDAAVIGSAFAEFRDSIMEISHCECNYIPGVLSHFKEQWEIAALASPKPLLIVHGAHDRLFPVSSVRRAVSELRRYYRLSRADPRLITLAVHPDGHRYDHTHVLPFLEKII